MSLVCVMNLVPCNATSAPVPHACYRVVLVPVYCRPSVVPVTRVAPPCHCSGSGADGDQDGAHVSADEYDVETRAYNLKVNVLLFKLLQQRVPVDAGFAHRVACKAHLIKKVRHLLHAPRSQRVHVRRRLRASAQRQRG